MGTVAGRMYNGPVESVSLWNPATALGVNTPSFKEPVGDGATTV